jgi:hypothetical protein
MYDVNVPVNKVYRGSGRVSCRSFNDVVWTEGVLQIPMILGDRPDDEGRKYL